MVQDFFALLTIAQAARGINHALLRTLKQIRLLPVRVLEDLLELGNVADVRSIYLWLVREGHTAA